MTALLAKTIGGIGCTVLALPLLAAAAVAGALTHSPASQANTLVASGYARSDIPPRMLALYQRGARECPGLAWTVLAAIGKVETNHGRHPTMISSAGAVGPMQFLPSTFKAYAHPVPPGGKNPPTPWDPVDAVHAAARLLCANGARDGRNLRRAIWHYNHSTAYVNQVLKIADQYAAADRSVSASPTGAARTAIAFARAQIGTPYVWGGDGPAEGGYDCSGLTQAAYRSAGIPIPRVAQDQFNAGPRLPRGSRPQPGDLLFYGDSPHHITHVALYIGNGRIIEAPRPGTTVRESPAGTNSPTYQGATRPAARSSGHR
ncbi:bifunctional lytic transglycosylase/C40 family peptidase [Streptomyces chengbuensis]|uniref:C40 family peptidase n=1 Tax=Streptomyces chengbuensis TaxID=3053466 RepID=UPI0025B2D83E|nr:bifunctional lytic transglycosylase/C40 family peptidase [Streptomyces sp. HUAS CB01]WJY53572.1 bifunctional lytic transglycosylase/C40 family peptidase [Streptomyces sp. HUAS CB01]